MNIFAAKPVFNVMKVRPLFIVAGVFLTCFTVTARAVNNPVGSGIVPPTSTRTGLIRSPNPLDTSGNLLITGNIRGGRYFRGVVPYQAPFSFMPESGSVLYDSSSLDSFVRDSAGSEDFGRYAGRYTGRYRPYYSPTGTVTTTTPGQQHVFRPPTAYHTALSAKTPSSTVGGFTQPALSQKRTLSRQPYFTGPQDATRDIWGPAAIGREMAIRRPMSVSPQQMEEELFTEVEKYQQEKRRTTQQYQKQLQQFHRDLQQVRDKAVEIEKELTRKDDSSELSTETQPTQDTTKWFETETPADQTGEDKQIDIYEQMKQQIDNLQKQLEQPSTATQTEEAADDEEKSSSLLDGLFKGVDLSVRAKAILGRHKTFASFSEDKFNQHLRTGEEHLKKGQYYRAADAYTLASIYKPDDPLPYAGKSHALFAAGEYMSSSLFLTRAIEMFPEYARFKIDVVAMLGDRDKLESRLADLREWIKITDAPELRFLIAYVYYQMGKVEWAKVAVDTAYEKMPTPAVSTLKEAIGDALESY